jgi:hypothetical protein
VNPRPRGAVNIDNEFTILRSLSLELTFVWRETRELEEIRVVKRRERFVRVRLRGFSLEYKGPNNAAKLC